VRPLIRAAADHAGLPSWGDAAARVWLEALVMTESSGNAKARRYEPHQDRPGRADAATDADRPGTDDGLLEDDASYGLCQVMGYNLRRYLGLAPGTTMHYGFAYRPALNIDAGIWVLQGDIAALRREGMAHGEHELVARALARYNGGPTGDDRGPTGAMRVQPYVDKVAHWSTIVLGEAGP
jgi:hypothetical protein